ncbi:MAG TPA: hypothetical protein V6D29_15890, partial [Leptolyngbyaceae cyanobacterium]
RCCALGPFQPFVEEGNPQLQKQYGGSVTICPPFFPSSRESPLPFLRGQGRSSQATCVEQDFPDSL